VVAGEPILVVDDNPANSHLLSALLSAFGYDVRMAATGQELMTVLESFQPRMILMDVQLPDADGLDLTRQLRTRPEMQSVFIVAVTASAMKGDEEKAQTAGCDGYITKPIDTRALPRTIAGYLERGARSAR